jgi:hypothetical protein
MIYKTHQVQKEKEIKKEIQYNKSEGQVLSHQ